MDDQRAFETQEKCSICGDKASGYHYNVLSCEGCKGFFRRSIQKSLSSKCRFEGNCDINLLSRRKCPACRFKKCLHVGMQENCLLTEHQCNARGFKRRMASIRSTVSKAEQSDETSSKSSGSSGQRTPNSESPPLEAAGFFNVESTPRVQSKFDLNANRMPDRLECEHQAHTTTVHHMASRVRMLIDDVVSSQQLCDKTLREQLESILQTRLDEIDDTLTAETRHLLYLRRTQQTILTTQLAVEFAKQMFCFTEFSLDDQIALIKASISHVLTLMMARHYDPKSDTIMFSENYIYTRDALKYAGLGDATSGLFRFCKVMNEMNTDAAEFALLTCLCIYSESAASVKDIDKVQFLQDVYSRALESHCNTKYRDGCQRFTKLIMKIINLRELNILQSDADLSFQFFVDGGDKSKLPSPIAELVGSSSKAQ